jgi:hypothetical protein
MLTEKAVKFPPSATLTSNGIHLTPCGYWRTAIELAGSGLIDQPSATSTLKLDADGRLTQPDPSIQVSDIKAASGTLTFTALRVFLPAPPVPADSVAGVDAVRGLGSRASITGLKPGKYNLKAGGEVIATATDSNWAKGVSIDEAGPDVDQAEALRKLIVAKNFDFFNYQRPDNDSYILAFRKGEQGRNAVEIPQFLPLMEEKEKQIALLRVPKPVTYTLEAVK